MARTLRSAGAAGRAGQSGRADETPTQDPCRARRLCAAQADGGAGVRDHQIGDGVSPVFAARVGACQPRMDAGVPGVERSEEHTSELQSLMRISYAVFCLKKKKTTRHRTQQLNEE